MNELYFPWSTVALVCHLSKNPTSLHNSDFEKKFRWNTLGKNAYYINMILLEILTF